MTGIFICARLGSTRLEQKHLIEVAGKSFIQWLVERLSFEFLDEIESSEMQIFITTSEKPENQKFDSIFDNTKVGVFHGSDHNIPLRHLQCAREYGIDRIISIDGDDILCSSEAARLVFKALNSGDEYIQTNGLPLGMNITGYQTHFLEQSLSAANNEVLETGWGKIFSPETLTSLKIGGYENLPLLRMTLDYQQDAEFFKTVISNCVNDIISMPDKLLIEEIVKQEWYKLNDALNEVYWENFNQQKQKEK